MDPLLSPKFPETPQEFAAYMAQRRIETARLIRRHDFASNVFIVTAATFFIAMPTITFTYEARNMAKDFGWNQRTSMMIGEATGVIGGVALALWVTLPCVRSRSGR
jgi:hypothetical protein